MYSEQIKVWFKKLIFYPIFIHYKMTVVKELEGTSLFFLSCCPCILLRLFTDTHTQAAGLPRGDFN